MAWATTIFCSETGGRAATLLFLDNPERYVSGAYIKIGFFVTDDDLRYQDEIHGNLFSQAENTLDLLFSKYAYISYRGIQRLEKFLFPYLAVVKLCSIHSA